MQFDDFESGLLCYKSMINQAIPECDDDDTKRNGKELVKIMDDILNNLQSCDNNFEKYKMFKTMTDELKQRLDVIDAKIAKCSNSTKDIPN